MTILFLTRSLEYGGAERQLVALAIGLKKRGYDVVVAVFYGGGVFEKQLRNCGIVVEDLEKAGRWDAVSFLIRCIKILRRTNANVIYGFLSFPNILAVIFRRFVPTARIVWGVRATNLEFHRYNWLVRWVYRTEDILAKHCDLIIANSYAGRGDCIKRKFPSGKIVVIPNGIDTDYFRLDTAAGQKVRARYNISKNEKLVGLVGRLDPMKDHQVFLAAFSILAEQKKYVRAIIVGDGDDGYRRVLAKKATQLGIDNLTVWVKACEAMPAMYSAMDVLVSSSRFGEGFPNVVAEAMSCSTPCVVTHVGDSARIVGDCGEVIEPRNANQMVRAIMKTLDTPFSETRAAKIRRHIEDHYSVSRCVAATESAVWPTA